MSEKKSIAASTLAEVATEIEALQAKLNGPAFKCTREDKAGRACTMQHEGKLDKEDRPVLYFAPGCKVAQTFCPACSAYWHVAVARNQLFDYARFAREDAAGASARPTTDAVY